MALYGDKKDGRELRIFENADELSCNLVEYIAELSEASIKERGVFSIALSGGSLVTLMGTLCEAPYNKTVDWAKWYIFWAGSIAAQATVLLAIFPSDGYTLVEDNGSLKLGWKDLCLLTETAWWPGVATASPH